jgi:ATP-dependent RNA helicase DeaD
MSQEQRDRVMRKLRGGKVDLLVATDVAARGLDIPHLTHVVNYDLPSAAKQYVHRIGRVGRAGREGVAITLAEPREHVMLKSIERLTKQEILVAPIPTVADLRTRRLELTRASVRESILEGGLDRFRVVVESLSDEFDLVDIAMGAVKMGHEATITGSEGDEEEIPVAKPFHEKSRGGKDSYSGSGSYSGPGASAGKGSRPRGGEGTPLFIGMGRSGGIRPKDIVGAITGEAGVDKRVIGSIQISERFTLVEVANTVSDLVLRALKGGTIRGKKVTVRLDKGRRGR